MATGALHVELGFHAEPFQLTLLALLEEMAGAEMFMRWPDRWWDAHVWRCANGHVSTTVLRSEALRRDACLKCQAATHLTFPEDRDGPLDVKRHPLMAAT